MIRLKFYALMILSVLTTIIGIYGYGRKAGERAAELDQQRQINDVRGISNDVENNTNAQSNDVIRTRLRDRWTRK